MNTRIISGVLLCCDMAASKKPIRCKMKKPQAVTVIGFVTYLTGYRTIEMSKSNQCVHGFCKPALGLAKRTLSPGCCSFFVNTAINYSLFTLFNAQNAPITPRGKFQVNSRRESIPWPVFADLSKTQRYNLKKVAPTFSSCNPLPFWPSAAKNTYW